MEANWTKLNNKTRETMTRAPKTSHSWSDGDWDIQLGVSCDRDMKLRCHVHRGFK